MPQTKSIIPFFRENSFIRAYNLPFYPIYAAQAGTVEYAGWISGYGYAVIINHGGGISTLYGHCQSLDVGTGQSVEQGELIAECGSTGNSTGPHCHFEVRVNGEPVNPLAYL